MLDAEHLQAKANDSCCSSDQSILCYWLDQEHSVNVHFSAGWQAHLSTKVYNMSRGLANKPVDRPLCKSPRKQQMMASLLANDEIQQTHPLLPHDTLDMITY
jgi:hypothetical protein